MTDTELEAEYLAELQKLADLADNNEEQFFAVCRSGQKLARLNTLTRERLLRQLRKMGYTGPYSGGIQ